MGDSRWPANEGWEKMSQKVETSIGTIDIHYNQNKIMNVFDDFKVK